MRADREKWDKKHKARSQPPAVNGLLREWAPTLCSGRALDLACGLGQNSLFLATLGFCVDAVDISPIALARIDDPKITTLEQDMDSFTITPGAYDLILNTFFLERRLFDGISRGLAPGGVLLFETWLESSTVVRTPAFKLRSGELAQAFADLEILSYGEQDGKASLMAKK